MRKFLLMLLVILTLPTLAQNDYQFRISSFMSQDAAFMNTYEYAEPTGSDLRSIHKIDFVDPIFPYEAIDSLVYDERGNITRLATYQLLDGEFKLTCFVDYTYNDMNLRVTRKNYNVWDDEIPTEPDGIITYFYDDNNKLIKEEMDFVGGIYQKTEYTYYEDGMLESQVVMLNKNFPPIGDDFENSVKAEYYYDDNNNLIETRNYQWDYSTWNMQSMEMREYDDSNNCTLVMSTTPTGAPQVKYVYKYDEKALAEDIYFYPNPENDYPTYPQMHNMLVSYEFWALDDSSGDLIYVFDYLVEYEQIGEGDNNAADVDIALEAIDANSIKATVTPNSYTVEYHVGYTSKAMFDQIGAENLAQALQADNNPCTGVQEFTYENLDANTEYVVIVTAKNSADEWIIETASITTPEVGYEDINVAIFNIYPNPAKDYIMIESENVEYVEVIDIYGRVITASEINGDTRIEMSDIAEGVYYVRLFSNGTTTIQKVIKK